LSRARHSVDDAAPVRRVGLADLVGLNDLLGRFDHWTARRAEVQRRRRRPDAEILGLFRTPLWCIEEERGYRELQSGLVRLFGLDGLFRGLDAGDPPPHR
ncbi:MAG TPA: hypothetical protein VJP77_00870, partial [Planctomycetota bacterium]|nr:hypothetical protein [Planctomycetota bacterium]